MSGQRASSFLSILAVTVLAVSPVSASAGGVPPELADLVRGAQPGEQIAVLVELDNRLDVESLAWPTKRARRTGIASALKSRAASAEAPVRGFLAARGATDVRSLWGIGAIAATVPAGAVRDLAGLPAVAAVRLDRSFSLESARPKLTADPGWNLEAIGAPDLWARGAVGDGVVVAVLDSGVDVMHPDLESSWRGGDNSWFDPHGEHATPYDADGHGTQIAGIAVGGDAGGDPVGVAPGARWIAGRIFDDDGQSTFGASHEVFQWLLDPDGDPSTDDAPEVVNASWGFRNNPGDCVDEFSADIQALRSAGMVVIFSAGNAGPGTGTSISPANNAGAVAVGGVDAQDQVLSSSSRGPSACDGSVFPTLVAPGDGVRTTDLTFGGVFPNSYVEVSGTSVAAPHVAGAVALLLGAHPGATVDQVEAALLAGAEDLAPDGPDNDSGSGRLDVVRADAELAAMTGAGDVTVFTDEAAFLAAVGGQPTLAESFEDDTAWGVARSPAIAPEVTSQGVVWASNHPDNGITTGSGPARTGDWGFYSMPHGDQTVSQPNDFLFDGFTGSASTAMTAIGGWFVSTAGGRLSLVLDGDETNPIDLGPVGITHGFLGAVVDHPFTTFEFRETEGTVEDPKYLFVDDVTVAMGGGGNRPPDGTILQPATDVTVVVGEPVSFAGAASDPDGDAVTVLWDFGDGTSSTALNPGDHTYAFTGGYTVTLTATDQNGLADPTPDSRAVTVTDAPPTPPTGVVAGVANVPGAFGSDWHTDLYLHNASSGAVSLSLAFSPADGTPGPPVALTIDADRTVVLEDVVSSEFGTTGSGAIHWTVVSGDSTRLLVSADTSNRVDATRRYGQQIPGIRWADVSPEGSSVWLPALAGRYRTNLGFATDADCTRVRIRGYDRFGVQVAQRILEVPTLTWVQLNSLFRRVFPTLLDDPDATAVADSVHRFEVVGVNGRVVAYTSLIDNVTNDGSYMLAQLPTGDGARAWLPGAAEISGANASRWRSDVIVMHVGGASDATGFGLFAAGANPSGPLGTEEVVLDPGASVVEEDILGGLFGYQPPVVGSLVATLPTASGAVVWMRTYTEEPIAGDAVRTYGQAIGPRSDGALITSAVEGRVAGFGHGAASRSNLILQNTRWADGAYLPSTAEVEVLGPDGALLHRQRYDLQPGEYRQHNRFLDDYGIPNLATGTLRVIVTSPAVAGETGGVDAMVSEVNGNTVDGTNDGRLIRAEVLP